MAILEVKEVTKYFGFPVLQNVNFIVREGESFGLIGPNGSGKTTMINIISGSLPADSGEIIFNNKNMSGISAHKRARSGIARTYQIPKPFLSLNVLDNVLIPLKSIKFISDEKKAFELLELIGIKDKAFLKPGDLTQIEMRKLELARALALNPKLLLLDEVMAGLTHSEVDETLDILRNINEQGVTIIMIEHIMRAVMTFCENIVVLNAGIKIAEGGPDEIFKDKEVERAYLGE